MTEKERIPASAEHISLVFGYGILVGFREMINKMDYTPEEMAEAKRLLYELNIKPMADLVREQFNITNAVSFDPMTLEFVIYEEQGNDVDFSTPR